MVKLGLDFGTTTGVAVLFDTGHFQTMTWTLRDDRDKSIRSPIPMSKLWRKLHTFAETYDIGSIAFEEPYALGNAKWMLDSMSIVTTLFAHEHGIPWQRVAVGTWKKQTVGHGRATPLEYLKYAQQQWPELEIHTTDEAAALCILQYATKER